MRTLYVWFKLVLFLSDETPGRLSDKYLGPSIHFVRPLLARQKQASQCPAPGEMWIPQAAEEENEGGGGGEGEDQEADDEDEESEK